MIVTVTLNPALDLTYAVDALVPHGTHRVATVAERPGGKGLNVARVLHTLGEPVLATGLLGGATGTRVAALLYDEGVPAGFVRIGGETRRTVAVVDGRDATGFWEPGPTVTPAEWALFLDEFHELLGPATVVTLSGSLPPGVPLDAYATLVALAKQAGVPAVLDTSGPALRHGLLAAPALAKPNADELAALAPASRPAPAPPGGPATGSIVAAVRGLAAGPVVVSRGAGGLLAVTPDEVWECAPPVPLDGNPTGAGDACVAALSRGLRDRTPWPELLADAVALSAAAVAAPVAGAFDPDVYRQTRTTARAVIPETAPGGPRARTHR
ncbi:1-phosphofructokinase family hexose kinase [Paractinoplanes ferrugineus]|uniref:Sugar kinase n=1 Tax=Paractinoplanes ferrugineus TaxID=113564 RepID=A0A919J7Y9_9ACTN|nr:1-phosphofructokinase family hexose kinase [Actinoplanes ferrugineus]GIE15743.1 sugar kinase [Actinoplanes ferrugineus]